MKNIFFYDFNKRPSEIAMEEIAQFLFHNLDEYGDPIRDIKNAIKYALETPEKGGGFILTKEIEGRIVCSIVVNRTGMSGYIPENILVYIATDRNQRGRGFGKETMQLAIEKTEGDIALHVEANNPARFLYEKLGFTNPYLEMRLKKEV